jgi:Protein of unknwon function (DUF3008)
MPAQSKAQQRFMGMVHAAQKGDMDNPSPEVKKAADSMSDKDAKDFASTKHDGLPDHVKEFIIREVRGIKTIGKEYGDVVDQIQKHLDLYKQTKGTPAEKQHVQQLKQLNDKKKALAAELDQKVSGMYKDAELKVDEMTGSDAAGDYNSPYAFSGKDSEAKKGKKQADLTGYTVVKENRWRDIKKEDAPATTKVNKGIANINHQLAEIEKFLGWYGKLKAENGVNNGNFWKRTNNHIYTIKERLLNLERQVRKISE